MRIIKNNTVFQSSRWSKIKTDRVISKRHQLYDFLEDMKHYGHIEEDENYVDYIQANDCKIPIDSILNRFGVMGFDLECERYPKEINGYTDWISIYNPVYVELDGDNYRYRIWKEIEA